MTRRRGRYGILGVLVGALLVGTGVIAVRQSGYGPRELVAAHLLGYLQSVPDELVEDELRQIAALDRLGLTVLLDALASPRPAVSQAAFAVLCQQMDAWKDVPSQEASASVAHLARGLAQRVNDWPSSTHSVARDLAIRILDWPIDRRRVDRAEILEHCAQVLQSPRGGPVSVSGPSQLASAMVPAAADIVIRDRRQPDQDVVPEAMRAAELAVPREDVFGEIHADTALHRSAAAEAPSAIRQREPRLLPTAQHAVAEPERRSAQEPAGETSEPSLVPEPRRAPETPTDTSAVSATDAGPVGAADGEPLSDLALIRQLGASNESSAASAEQQLRQRGFRERDLAYARQLISPHVSARRELVESVGQSNAAAQWLIWLSHDPDAEVRKVAVSRLITAQDPRVTRRLLELENAEVNEDIRRQLQQWREAEAAVSVGARAGNLRRR